MSTLLIILCCIAWYLLGVWSYIYFMRKDFDILLGDLVIALIVGIGGLWTLFFTWLICDNKKDIIVFKRKHSS